MSSQITDIIPSKKNIVTAPETKKNLAGEGNIDQKKISPPQILDITTVSGLAIERQGLTTIENNALTGNLYIDTPIIFADNTKNKVSIMAKLGILLQEPTESLDVSGNANIRGNVIANNLTINNLVPQSLVFTDANKMLTTTGQIDLSGNVTGTLSISSGGTNSNSALVGNKLMISNSTSIIEGTSASNPAFTGINLSGLSASEAVITDSLKNLGSLPYSIAATPLTLVERDASGNVMANNIGDSLLVGTLDSNTASANGAVIFSGELTLQSASSIYPGLVNTTTQSFAGNKTFNNNVQVTGNLIASTIDSVGSTLNLGCNDSTAIVNLGCATDIQTINLGSGNGITTINIGGIGDIVNIDGSLNYISSTIIDVSGKYIQLNSGSIGSGTATNSGLFIRDNSNNNAGYIATDSPGTSFKLKAPGSAGILSTPILSTNDTVTTNNLASTLTNKTLSSPNITGTANISGLTAGLLTIASGGNIGSVNATNHTVQVGNSLGTISSISAGTTGQILVGTTGSDPSFTSSPSITGTITASTGMIATTGNIVASGGSITAFGSMTATNGIVTAGSGIVSTLGNITASSGNIIASDGNITASGSITATAGTITAGTGITVSTGNITVSNGNVTASGSMTATTGTITAGGGITATAGHIVASSGNITATSGTITAGTGVTATTGNIVASSGNITASGSMTATSGTMTAGTGITSTTGNIVASSGDITASGSMTATSGTMTAGTGITSTTGNITASSGNITASGSITSTSGNVTALSGGLIATSTSADSSGSNLNLIKNRSAGVITPGDILGNINFEGYDSSANLTASKIMARSNGTIAANRIGSNLEFYTHPDSTIDSTQRMSINSAGTVKINTSDSGFNLNVADLMTVLNIKTIYTTIGISSFTIPTEATNMVVKLWGAGGNGEATASTGLGGGGGSTITTLNVIAGDTYYILIGGTTNTFINGGTGGTNAGNGGSASALFHFTGGNYVLKAVAGGGGGASNHGTNTVAVSGGGGGQNGTNGTASTKGLIGNGTNGGGLAGTIGNGGVGDLPATNGKNLVGDVSALIFSSLTNSSTDGDGGNGGPGNTTHPTIGGGGGGGGGYGGGGGGAQSGTGTGNSGASGAGGINYAPAPNGSTFNGNGQTAGNITDTDFIAAGGTALYATGGTANGGIGKQGLGIVLYSSVADATECTIAKKLLITDAIIVTNNISTTAGNLVAFGGSLIALNGNLTLTEENADTSGTNINLIKNRSSGVITTGDTLGNINFEGFDGSNNLIASKIISTSSGTIANNRIGSNLEFYTHPDSTTTSTQRMLINSDGNVIINPSSIGYSLNVADMLTVRYGKTLYTTVGITSFTVPALTTKMIVKLWGAGGNSIPITAANFGGGGGAITLTLNVVSGDTYYILVGGSGNTFMNGGIGNDGSNGGAATALFHFTGGNYVLKAVAAGGGGTGGGSISIQVGGIGGGGGQNGGSGVGVAPGVGGSVGNGTNGGGSGGADGAGANGTISTSGKSLIGDVSPLVFSSLTNSSTDGDGGAGAFGRSVNSAYGNGGGGGGGYGGGGGGGKSGTGNDSGGGGAGGINYAPNGTSYNGSGQAAGNNTDPDYVAAGGTSLYATGGTPSGSLQSGKQGIAVIIFSDTNNVTENMTIKKLTVTNEITTNSGLLVPTSGGTASMLTYFEKTGDVSYSFIGPVTINANVSIVRIENHVSVTVRTGFTTSSTTDFFTSTTAIAAQFRPPQTVNKPWRIISSGAGNFGEIVIGTDGFIRFYASFHEDPFPSGVTVGWSHDCASYDV